ncbi:hypothetical protein N7530_003977, partial [Penicillium desertorum]
HFSEFEDEERKQLIADIISQDPSLATILRANSSALWFSDIESLRGFAKVLQENGPTSNRRYRMLTSIDLNDMSGIVASGNQQGPALGRTSPLLEAERQKREDVKIWRHKVDFLALQCLERDNAKCILTRRDQPGLQCAHIVPYKLSGSSALDNTWKWLETFWVKAEVLGGPNHWSLFNTEQLKNQITLGSQEHNYWDNCMFAFRPVRTYQQNTKMDIAFHLLPLREGEKRSDLSHPHPSHPRGYTSPGGNRYPFHCETLHAISSGHIFTVNTANPVTHPLPSEELLTI